MKWYYYALIILVGLALIAGVLIALRKTKTGPIKNQPVAITSKSKPTFTYKIFDTDKVAYILPLGELNGGGDELQTLNGVMVQLNQDKVKDSPVEVYAPVDLELKSYVYMKDSKSPEGDWNLEFRIDEERSFNIHHLNNPVETIRTVATGASGSTRPVDVKRGTKIKAGELIGTTRGTSLANNWNIYLSDKTKSPKTRFANQARYENGGYLGEGLLNAVCPFDYYEDESIKNSYYALLGSSKAGLASSCGSPSKDKLGTLSGLWHLKPTGIESGYEEEYSNPLSVMTQSDENVVIYELNRKSPTITPDKKSYKKPEDVTDSHCYNLADDWGNIKQGYAFFKLDSPTEMSLAYSSSGSCPSEFPQDAKKYYR